MRQRVSFLSDMKSTVVENIQKNLLDWYRKNHRKLPWRKTKKPYHIWVSEVMLQQTQVNTVVPYYEKFVHRFPGVRRLANADLQEVLKLWEGLGYYTRARNLHRAAKQVVTEHHEAVPGTLAEFKALPGVGDYIASAVQSIAFNQPYAVVDGNVKRVLARLFEISAPVNQSGSYAIFRDTAQALLDSKSPGMFNQAVMELGALICKPMKPDCASCPVHSNCLAYQENRVSEFPIRIKRKPTPIHHMVVGVVHKKNKVLITQRKPEGLLGGLWEFPCGTIQNNETPEDACVKSIKEAVNLTVKIKAFLTQIKHAYTHFKITMDVYTCEYVSGRVKLNGAVDYRWISLKNIGGYPFHKANHKFISLIK